MAPHVELAGPTSFAPLIELAMEVVQAQGRSFHTLVILADGMVTDEDRDIQAKPPCRATEGLSRCAMSEPYVPVSQRESTPQHRS